MAGQVVTNRSGGSSHCDQLGQLHTTFKRRYAAATIGPLSRLVRVGCQWESSIRLTANSLLREARAEEQEVLRGPRKRREVTVARAARIVPVHAEDIETAARGLCQRKP